MGIFDNCLLASDIDGTLAEFAKINPENIRMIDYFINEGGIFTLATGRSIGNLKPVEPVLKQLTLPVPIVVADGCMIYDYQNKNTVFEVEIEADDRYIAKYVLDNYKDVGLEFYVKEKVFTVNRTMNTTAHQEIEQFTSSDAVFDDVLPLKWSKVMFICSSEAQRKELRSVLQQFKSNSYFGDAAGDHGGEILYYLEQKPQGVTKASTLLKYCKQEGIKKGGFFAIGDYINDIAMLDAADVAAVPESSFQMIKEHADYITKSCKDGAVADFIVYLSKLSV